jgi:hypothetical protein
LRQDAVSIEIMQIKLRSLSGPGSPVMPVVAMITA